jgi:hypothetical protein
VASSIFIPNKISVGFQNRSGTYTGKLAYIIYYDEKGVLRKERSWNGWRDEKIEAVVCDNEPTSGFVLNKKAGGYDTGWSHRQTYCRIYDPRGFEFEITIENLLYILENTNSIIGKGLEGEFVYGWSGKDLILIPTNSPDYKELVEYNKIIHEKNYVKSKDLVIGGTYKTKNNEEYIYLGRFDYHGTKYEKEYLDKDRKNNNYIWVNKNINKGKHYFFGRLKTYSYIGGEYLDLLTLKSLGQKFISVVSNECVGNYADLYEMLEVNTAFSPYDITKDEYIPYTLEEFTEYANDKIESWSSFKFFANIDGKYMTQEVEYKRDKKLFFVYGEIDYSKSYWDRSRAINYIGDGSIEAVFNQYKPAYKNKYLANEKFYEKAVY